MTQLQSPSADFTIEDMDIGDRKRMSNLTIIGTQPSDAGAYSCVVVNELGNITAQVTLTVHGKCMNTLVIPRLVYDVTS